MYKSYSYNNMPKAITYPEKSRPQPPPPPVKKEPEKEQSGILGGILGNFELDDIILLIVVAALLLDDCEDKLLIGALAFIFFADFF